MYKHDFNIDFRPNLILDLDNTLLHSLSLSEELGLVPIDFQNKFNHVDMKRYYRIFERPYLNVFLDYIFINFNVSIFTAADKDYALFIIENIILKGNPKRKIEYIFCGYHSGISESIYKSPKDLRLLWNDFKLYNFRPCSTVIIDDLNEVKMANPHNTIQAPKFELLNSRDKVNYSALNDMFLLQVINDLETWRKRVFEQKCFIRSPLNK